MSLTSRLRDLGRAESKFFRERFPNVLVVGKKWLQQLVGAETIRPPQAPEPTPWPIIGQAVDYRIRYYFAVTPLLQLVAGKAMKKLSKTIETTDLFSGRPEVRKLWGKKELYLPPDEPVFLYLPKPAYDFCMSLENFFESVRPAGRRLPPQMEEHLCQHCYGLALFEMVGRQPWEYESPLYGLPSGASAEDMLALAGTWWVEDLCRLSSLFYERCAQLVRPDAVLNPIFEGSIDIEGADADFIVDGLLINIKTTVSPKFDRQVLYQLLGYVLLDYSDRYAIHSVGVYLARQGVLVQMPIDEFLASLSGLDALQLPELREDFRKLAVQE
jgi:hypothetical protein